MSFLSNKYAERKISILKNAEFEEKNYLINELNSYFSLMHDFGVENEQDFKDFYYINANIKEICYEILKYNLSSNNINKVAKYIYNNREENSINTIFNFYKSAEKGLNSIGLNSSTLNSIKKKAYPQAFSDFHINPAHNISKWLDTTRKIYSLRDKGFELGQATDELIKEWSDMEKFDFKNWLNFYQSGQQDSYKTAQHVPYFVGEGVKLPSSQLKSSLPGIPSTIGFEEFKNKDKEFENSYRNSLLNKKKALIGRLNSAEKIFTSEDFKKLLGSEAEANAWLESLHSLKRKIQTSSVRNASTIEDMIVLSSNQLKSKGFVKSASIMLKLAQAAPPTINTPVPDFGMNVGEDVGVENSSIPELPMNQSEIEPDEDLNDPEAAMKEFLENLGVVDEDEQDVKDHNTKNSNDNFDGAMIIVSEDGLSKKAQAVSAPTEEKPKNQAVAPPAPTEPQKDLNGNATIADAAIEKALENVTYDDIIVKLEGLATLFKQRQVVRELTIVDLMMQSVGVASFFPSLAEATKSALDSNQYVLTRVEDIIAKLRGATGLTDGTLSGLKQKLEQDSDNKDAKKIQKSVEEINGPPVEQTAPPAPTGAADLEKELSEPAKVAPPAPTEQVAPNPGAKV